MDIEEMKELHRMYLASFEDSKLDILKKIKKKIDENEEVARIYNGEIEDLGYPEFVFYLFYLCIITDVEPEFFFDFFKQDEEYVVRKGLHTPFLTYLFIIYELYNENDEYKIIWKELFNMTNEEINSFYDMFNEERSKYIHNPYFYILTTIVFQRIIDFKSYLPEIIKNL